MVVTVPEGAGPRRYHVLDTLRAFAIEQLRTRPAEFDAACDAHALHYLDRLAALPPWRNIARDLRTEFEPDLGNIFVAADRAGRQIRRPGGRDRSGDRAARVLAHEHRFVRRSAPALRGRADGRARRLRAGAGCSSRSAYLEATQDGTSDFVSIAAQALQYLTPGDGVWSGCAGNDVGGQPDVRARLGGAGRSRTRSSASTIRYRRPRTTIARCSTSTSAAR